MAIAKAVKAENINKLLTTCEKEFPKLDQKMKMTMIYYLSGTLKKATESQNARWIKIVEANTKK